MQVQLDDCKTHTDLVEYVKELVEDTDLKLDQAVRRALAKKRKELEIVMEPDLADEEEKMETDREDSSMEESPDDNEEEMIEEEDEQEEEDEEEAEEEDEEEEEEESLEDVI